MGKNTVTTVIDGTLNDDLIIRGFYTDGDGDTVTDGVDFIYGFDGNDTIFAEDGDDQVWGGNDNDVVIGGGGNDRLRGDNGDDLLDGGTGDDRLWGGNGNDTLVGGDGNDRLYGNKGNNLLSGGAGNDILSSGDQTSTLDGGADNDVLELRTKQGGDHIATGGTGADTFKFIQTGYAAVSDVTITDFEPGIDTMLIEGVDLGLYLSSSATVISGNETVTVLALDTGDSITLDGLALSDFNDFYFGVG